MTPVEVRLVAEEIARGLLIALEDRIGFQPAWLTMEAAHQYCGLSIRTLERRGAEGAFKIRNRGLNLIERQSLDDWIEDGVTGRSGSTGKGARGG